MRKVFIIGTGQTPVGEHWGTSLRHLALAAVEPALKSAGVKYPDALFVGNMLAGELSRQKHLGALIADFCGLRGVEAVTIEAAGASGGAAVRQAYLAICSGAVDTALVVGVEKMTDKVGSSVAAAVAGGADSDWELAQGATVPTIAALLLRRYLHEYGLELSDMAAFSVNAHANACTNPNAMFRNPLKPEAYAKAPMVAAPVNMFDSAPDGDGAAAVVLAAADALYASGHSAGGSAVRIAGSAIATDALALHDRQDPLWFDAAATSAARACAQAGIMTGQVDVFELHDSFTVYAALLLEATQFAARGEGWKLAQNGAISLTGRIPISTFGGLKARGNPGGATGVYQVVEIVQQLRGEAGDNQVPGARWGMAQCLGGSGATAATHILEGVDK